MRTILLFALCCLSSILLTAQLQLGIKGGANFSYEEFPIGNLGKAISPNPEPFTTINSSIIGLQAGLSIKYTLSKRFKLQSDISYNRMGGRFSIQDRDVSPALELNYKSVFDYITIPLHLQFYPMERWSIDVGPQIGFLVNQEKSFSPVFPINDLDYGLNLGTTFEINKQLDFQFRFYLGLNPTDEILFVDANGEPIDKIKFKNRSLQFSMIYYPFSI